MSSKFSLTLNQLKEVRLPQVILCNRNKTKLGELAHIQNLKICMNMKNEPNECSFTVYKYYNGIENPLWDKVTDLKMVLIPTFGYFEIYVNKEFETAFSKKIQGKSIEVELGQLYLNNFQINDVNDDTYEDYEIVKFYNPLDPNHSLLHISLEKSPAWTIGHVDEVLMNKQRTFSIDNVTIYDFLVGDVSEQFDCMFEFDTFNREINVYNADNYCSDTNIYLSLKDFLENITIESNVDEVKNCFHVVGGDGIDVREVNPNGTNYIWMFSKETKEEMNINLVQKLSAYDTLYASKQTEYDKFVLQMQSQVKGILDLYDKFPDKSEDLENWKKYGLTPLNEKLETFQSIEDMYKTNGQADPTHKTYQSLYVPNHSKITAIQVELEVRKKEIESANTTYKNTKAEIAKIQDSLNLEKYLGTELWKELSLYRREYRFENTNYTVTDETTDEERIKMEKDLLIEANKELQKACNPKLNLTVSMSNLLANDKLLKQNIEDFRLGNFIRAYDGDILYKIRLVSVIIDFDNIQQIQVEFSDVMRSSDITNVVGDKIDKAYSAATSYDTIIKQYDANKGSMDYVSNMIRDGLSSMLSESQNANNQEFTIGSRGIIGREYNAEKGDYENEQVHIIKNQILFTDNNWKSAVMGVGKITLGNTKFYGLIGDVIIGKLVASNKLSITNKSGSFVVDENGVMITDLDLQVTNGTNTLKIDPKSNEIFKILKGDKKVLYMDVSGNAHFEGDLTGATGTFSGLLSGGSINLGNGKFTVDTNGNVKADNADLKGTVTAIGGKVGGFTINENSLSGNGLISGGSITGALITASNSFFTSATLIDCSVRGNLVANDASITVNSSSGNQMKLSSGKLTTNGAIGIFNNDIYCRDIFIGSITNGLDKTEGGGKSVKNLIDGKSDVNHAHSEYAKEKHSHDNYVEAISSLRQRVSALEARPIK